MATRPKIKNKKIKVSLYVRYGRWTGRFLGIGSITASNKQGKNVKESHQLFRMDYHNPHGDNFDFMTSEGYHFHIAPSTKKIK